MIIHTTFSCEKIPNILFLCINIHLDIMLVLHKYTDNTLIVLSKPLNTLFKNKNLNVLLTMVQYKQGI